MTKPEYIVPSVNIDGRVVHPTGWMWELGFALGGCEWAIKVCDANQWRAKVRQYYRDCEKQRLEQQIADVEKQLVALKAELNIANEETNE